MYLQAICSTSKTFYLITFLIVAPLGWRLYDSVSILKSTDVDCAGDRGKYGTTKQEIDCKGRN